MGSRLRLLVLAGLSWVLAGSSCDGAEAVTLEHLRQDVAPPFDYALYRDEQGRPRAQGSDVLLVHRSTHLEKVYADAQRGDARARTLFGQVEAQVAATGGALADQALGLMCLSLRQTQRGSERRHRLGSKRPDAGHCPGTGRSQRGRSRGTRLGPRSPEEQPPEQRNCGPRSPPLSGDVSRWAWDWLRTRAVCSGC